MKVAIRVVLLVGFAIGCISLIGVMLYGVGAFLYTFPDKPGSEPDRGTVANMPILVLIALSSLVFLIRIKQVRWMVDYIAATLDPTAGKEVREKMERNREPFPWETR